jgi:A/G-specific adenine glycosylase
MPADLSPAVSARRAALLHRRLLAWYDVHRRDMPWRRTREPYPVWLSEVMLQQTQVATARPYFDAFLARFPTLEALARARPAAVLAAWAGLGYYRRARHLHEAARTVVREHRGRVPDDPEAFGRLPGVGRYTTGAVLSICFDRPLPVLDGNVARVLSRWFAVPAGVRQPGGARRLWSLAEALVSMRRPGDWNQALMELGATVCTAAAPACGRCPVRRLCRARELGRVAEFPPVAPRRRPERVEQAAALVAHGRRLLMVRREGARLAGLWEPPSAELSNGIAPQAALRSTLARIGVRARLAPAGRIVRHAITHQRIETQVWNGTLAGAVERTAGVRWVDPRRPNVPLTALARKLTTVPTPRPRAAKGADHG